MKTWKKGLALALALSMVIPGVYLGEKGIKEVQAEEPTTAVVEADKPMTNSNYSIQDVEGMLASKTAPTEEGYLFAGWFNDDACSKESAIKKAADIKGTTVYAKFIPEGVLSVKAQATQKVVEDTDPSEELQKYQGNYVLRFVSSVDGLDYQKVGFVVKEGSDGAEKRNTTGRVFKRIESTTGGAEYLYSPKVVDTKAEYFITAKLPVDPEKTDMNITVQAFWYTLDGTEVRGASRCISVDDGQIGTETINLSFKNTSGTAITKENSLTVEAEGHTGLSVDEVIGVSEGGMVHVRISGAKKNLKSVTEFKFQENGTEVGSAIYRNYNTKYTGTATTIDTTWYNVYEGKGETEFAIATSADLYGFASLVNAKKDFGEMTVYEVADIEINEGTSSDWQTAAPTCKWTNAIGNGTGNPFKGTFDGQGHTISGLYRSGAANSALFGCLGEAAVIKNLTLKNSYIKGSVAVSAIAGQGGKSFENISVSDDVILESTSRMTGGIVAKATMPANITNCDVAATIIAGKQSDHSEANSSQAGGLVGLVQLANPSAGSVTIDTCKFSGNLQGYAEVGGIIGQIQTTASLNNCYVNAIIRAENYEVGGLIGDITFPAESDYKAVSIKNCLNAGAVSSGAVSGYARVAGFVGVMGGASSADVENCLNVGMLTKESGASQIGGFFGLRNGYATINNSYYVKTEGLNYQGAGSGKITGNTASTVDAWLELENLTGEAAYTNTWLEFDDPTKTALFDGCWVITENTPMLRSFVEGEIVNPTSIKADTRWYNPDMGSAEDPYVIRTAEELAGLRDLSIANDFSGKTVQLGADITIYEEPLVGADGSIYEGLVDGYNWEPISKKIGHYFNGVFDGNNHTLSGLYCDQSTTNNIGVFSQLGTAAEIKNLNIENSYFSGKAAVAAVTGQGGESFIHITVGEDVTLKSTDNMLAGIIGKATTAGMVIANCDVAATITGDAVRVGGIVGAATATVSVKTCKFSGTVTGTSATNGGVGGVIGCVDSVKATVSDCYVTAEAKIIQKAKDGNVGVGGIIGWITGTPAETPVVVEYCLNEGTIEHDIENQTKNTGRARIGGIVGTCAGSCYLNVYNSLSVGTFIYPTDPDEGVTEPNLQVGAFLGLARGTNNINNSYAFGNSTNGSGGTATVYTGSKLVKSSEEKAGLLGEAALTNAESLFAEYNGGDYWTISSTTPKLISFQ